MVGAVLAARDLALRCCSRCVDKNKQMIGTVSSLDQTWRRLFIAGDISAAVHAASTCDAAVWHGVWGVQLQLGVHQTALLTYATAHSSARLHTALAAGARLQEELQARLWCTANPIEKLRAHTPSMEAQI